MEQRWKLGQVEIIIFFSLSALGLFPLLCEEKKFSSFTLSTRKTWNFLCFPFYDTAFLSSNSGNPKMDWFFHFFATLWRLFQLWISLFRHGASGLTRKNLPEDVLKSFDSLIDPLLGAQLRNLISPLSDLELLARRLSNVKWNASDWNKWNFFESVH